MTDREFHRLLQSAHERAFRDGEQGAGHEHPGHGPCLSVSRAQALVFDPELRTASEGEHLAGCPACQRVLEKVRLQTMHPNLLFLLRDELGILPPGDARVLRLHLGGGCRHCRARKQALDQQRPWVAQVAVPADEGPGLTEEGVSPNGQVTVEWLHGDEPGLEVRTRDAGLAGQLLGYTVADGDGRALVEGASLLRPERDGWWVARLPLASGALPCPRAGVVAVCPLPAGALGAEEQPILAAARFRERSDPEACRRWLAWADAVRLSEGLRREIPEEPDRPGRGEGL